MNPSNGARHRAGGRSVRKKNESINGSANGINGSTNGTNGANGTTDITHQKTSTIIFHEPYSVDELIQKMESESTSVPDKKCTCLRFLSIKLKKDESIDNILPRHYNYINNFQGIEFLIDKSSPSIDDLTELTTKLRKRLSNELYFSIRLENSIARIDNIELLLSKFVLIHIIGEIEDRELIKKNHGLSICRGTGPGHESIIFQRDRILITGFETRQKKKPRLRIVPSKMPSIVLLSPMTVTNESIQQQLHDRRRSGYQDVSHETLHAREGYNYASYLEFWGIAILITSCIIFILGIMTVLGIWDGAGEEKHGTYAEYEETTGFPMRNYYPSIVVLTGVIAWVWCIISWMGMKFFRHSRGGANKR